MGLLSKIGDWFANNVLGVGATAANVAAANQQAKLNYQAQKYAADLNYKSVQDTNQAQKDLAAYSYEQQKAMIQEQNEYNSPAAQMQRYRDAGINPNLVYGQIGNGNQNQTAQYQAPKLDAPQYAVVASQQIGAVANALTDSILKLQQVNKNNVDILNKKLAYSLQSEFGRDFRTQQLGKLQSENVLSEIKAFDSKVYNTLQRKLLGLPTETYFKNAEMLLNRPFTQNWLNALNARYQYEPALLDINLKNAKARYDITRVNEDILKFQRQTQNTDKIINNVGKVLNIVMKAFGF